MDLLGMLLYAVTGHQFMHTLVWATNAAAKFPWLNLLFPGSIDGTDPWFKEVYKYDYYPMVMQNIPLLLVMLLHHSVFARPWLQERLISMTSRAVERTLYVFVTTVLNQWVMASWKPMPHEVWSLQGPFAWIMELLCFTGFAWSLLTIVSTAYNDLFGFREAFTGVPPKPVPRYIPLVYQYMRQPLWFGMVLALWSAAEMSAGRLLFTVTWTIYSWIAGHMQERDLLRRYGKEFEDYQRRVPMLIPFSKF